MDGFCTTNSNNCFWSTDLLFCKKNNKPSKKKYLKKEEISFDLVFLDEGIDMIQESQHTFIEYKTIKEVIDTGTLIMMLTRAGAVLYFEKKNATKLNMRE